MSSEGGIDLADLERTLLESRQETIYAARAEDAPGNVPPALGVGVAKPKAKEGTKKRGPGRPSKTPKAPEIQMLGIVDAPRYSDNLLELASGNPQAFKGLFSFFEKLRAETLHIHATPRELIFYTEDTSGLLRVRAAVKGDAINHYYCAESFWLSINREDVSKPTGCIDKSFHKLTIIYKRSDPGLLEFVACDLIRDKDNRFPISVQPATPNPHWTRLAELDTERDAYPLSWSISQKGFKKCHDIACRFAKTITIEKFSNTPLTLIYEGSGVAPFSEVYRDPQKIGLRSEIREGEVFRVDYDAECGKTLSSAIPSETVRVHCKMDSPLLFHSEENGISILTAMGLY